MAYVGHILGPRKSELISRHNPEFFGCDESDYDDEPLRTYSLEEEQLYRSRISRTLPHVWYI
ncbi:MAG: hypothetical protein J4473_01985 [Candidatus Aenigmarchaeota archaeon]|nr:hypothetical protein [Candidatus Aenigmarchaeota archaeon]